MHYISIQKKNDNLNYILLNISLLNPLDPEFYLP